MRLFAPFSFYSKRGANEPFALRLISHKLPLTSCKLRLSSNKLPLSSNKLRLSSNKLPLSSNKLPLSSNKLSLSLNKLRLSSCKLRLTSYKLPPVLPFRCLSSLFMLFDLKNKGQSLYRKRLCPEKMIV